jgi:hypothetical protein
MDAEVVGRPYRSCQSLSGVGRCVEVRQTSATAPRHRARMPYKRSAGKLACSDRGISYRSSLQVKYARGFSTLASTGIPLIDPARDGPCGVGAGEVPAHPANLGWRCISSITSQPDSISCRSSTPHSTKGSAYRIEAAEPGLAIWTLHAVIIENVSGLESCVYQLPSHP